MLRRSTPSLGVVRLWKNFDVFREAHHGGFANLQSKFGSPTIHVYVDGNNLIHHLLRSTHDIAPLLSDAPATELARNTVAWAVKSERQLNAPLKMHFEEVGNRIVMSSMQPQHHESHQPSPEGKMDNNITSSSSSSSSSPTHHHAASRSTITFVFDGLTPPGKMVEKRSREKIRQKVVAESRILAAAGEVALARALLSTAPTIGAAASNSVVQMLRHNGHRVIVAPFEAEAQIAFLCRQQMATNAQAAAMMQHQKQQQQQQQDQKHNSDHHTSAAPFAAVALAWSGDSDLLAHGVTVLRPRSSCIDFDIYDIGNQLPSKVALAAAADANNKQQQQQHQSPLLQELHPTSPFAFAGSIHNNRSSISTLTSAAASSSLISALCRAPPELRLFCMCASGSDMTSQSSETLPGSALTIYRRLLLGAQLLHLPDPTTVKEAATILGMYAHTDDDRNNVVVRSDDRDDESNGGRANSLDTSNSASASRAAAPAAWRRGRVGGEHRERLLAISKAVYATLSHLVYDPMTKSIVHLYNNNNNGNNSNTDCVNLVSLRRFMSELQNGLSVREQDEDATSESDMLGCRSTGDMTAAEWCEGNGLLHEKMKRAAAEHGDGEEQASQQLPWRNDCDGNIHNPRTLCAAAASMLRRDLTECRLKNEIAGDGDVDDEMSIDGDAAAQETHHHNVSSNNNNNSNNRHHHYHHQLLGWHYCDLCGVKTSDFDAMTKHLLGRRHLAKAAIQRLTADPQQQQQQQSHRM